jgi:hypothetical protein
VLLTVISQWPVPGPALSIGIFGSFARFWKFLYLTYSLERRVGEGAVSCSGLLQKLRESLQTEGDPAGLFVRRLLTTAIAELKSATERSPSGMAVARTFETPHPYPDNHDVTWVVHIPGAKRIKVRLVLLRVSG